MWKCQKTSHTNSRICVLAHAHALNVCSTRPPATAEMSQRGSPLRMLLAALFSGSLVLPVSAPSKKPSFCSGEGAAAAVVSVAATVFVILSNREGKVVLFFLFVSLCFVSSFWILQTRLNSDLFRWNQPSTPPRQKHLASAASISIDSDLSQKRLEVRSQKCFSDHPADILARWPVTFFCSIFQKLNCCLSGLDTN